MSSNTIRFEDFKTIMLNIEHNLYLPSELRLLKEDEKNDDSGLRGRNNLFKIYYDTVNQPIQLYCGCIISKNIRLQYYQDDELFDYLQRQHYFSHSSTTNIGNDDINAAEANNTYKIKMNFENHKDICPICYEFTDLLNGKSVKPLVQLYNQLQFLKHKYSISETAVPSNDNNKSEELELQKAIKHRKKTLENSFNKVFNHENSDGIYRENLQRDKKPQSLLQLFQSISLEVKREMEEEKQDIKTGSKSFNDSNITRLLDEEKSRQQLLEKSIQSLSPTKKDTLSHFEFNLPILNTFENNNGEDIKSISNKSNQSRSSTIQKATNSLLSHKNKNSKKYSIEITEDDENKEICYSKCFPMYRKRSQFNVHSKFFAAKSKLFVNTDISQDCSKFVLLSEHKWEVYEILANFSEKKNEQPFKMLCCGKVNGDYGKSFNDLIKNEDTESIKPDESYRIMLTDLQMKKKFNNEKNKVNDWDHLFCKIMNDYLIIAGTKGILRIIDLKQNGKILKTLKYSFPIRCIDVDCSRNKIACGITGKDRTSGAEQALIVFQNIETSNKNSLKLVFPPPSTITLPYRDPINTLQFSDDGMYLSCSTCFENRFLIISLKKADEPRLIMKSIRNIDNSFESEGITSTHIFPGNAGLMCVTSVAYNSPPIVLDTKIKSFGKKNIGENSKLFNGPNVNNLSLGNNSVSKDSKMAVLQPSMLLRLDELGAKIYKCEISPRNDSIAFLDKNGTIYLMVATTNSFTDNNEKRRIIILETVSNAYKLREAASMKFNKNGHKLYLVDRKGMFYIEDFAAGLPQDNFVTKCKQMN